MSERLHDLKPLKARYQHAFFAGDVPKINSTTEKLIYYYDDWLKRANYTENAVFEHCAQVINDTLEMAYDANNYRVDPEENEFTTPARLRSRFVWRLREESAGKDLKLIATSGYELFDFYDRLPWTLMGKPAPVVTMPKKGQVVVLQHKKK